METERDAPTVTVSDDADVVLARQRGRSVAEQLGMSSSQQTVVATAISEIARNIVVYAGRGTITITVVDNGSHHPGLQVIARDDGPGIDDVEQALKDGFSTAGSLGLGLPGARRLMDDFVLESTPGAGTTVTMRKWVSEPR